MPLLDIAIVAAGLILIGSYGALSWHPGPKRARGVGRPDPKEIERLGEALALWHFRTREVVALLEVFREQTLALLDREREFADSPRSLQRQVIDANYLCEIRKAPKAGEAWLDAAAALPEVARRVLGERDVDPESLQTSFEFPWGLSIDHDRKRDRSDEIEVILAAIDDATKRLVTIDHQRSGVSAAPYR